MRQQSQKILLTIFVLACIVGLPSASFPLMMVPTDEPPGGGASAPAAPSNLRIESQSGSSVLLKWNDNSDNEEWFMIQRKQLGGSYSTIAMLASNSTGFVDMDLSASDIPYYYRVSATNSIGVSNYTEAHILLTPLLPPSAPMNLSAISINMTQIVLSWGDASANETSFVLERKIDGGSYSSVPPLPANTTTFLDSGLLPNVTYIYRLKARNSAGDSAYSNEVAIATQAPPPPPAPLQLISVGPNASGVCQISWGTPSYPYPITYSYTVLKHQALVSPDTSVSGTTNGNGFTLTLDRMEQDTVTITSTSYGVVGGSATVTCVRFL